MQLASALSANPQHALTSGKKRKLNNGGGMIFGDQ